MGFQYRLGQPVRRRLVPGRICIGKHRARWLLDYCGTPLGLVGPGATVFRKRLALGQTERERAKDRHRRAPIVLPVSGPSQDNHGLGRAWDTPS